jgi:hypothetical protein
VLNILMSQIVLDGVLVVMASKRFPAFHS